jgi:hypothetical protein
MTCFNFKSKKFLTAVISFFLLAIFVLPVLTHAADPIVIVPCDGTTAKPCDFDAFIKLLNNIITWILSIATTIFAISFIYGGFLYVTSGDKPGNRDKAKDILWSTLKGFVIILVAWLIVYTILINLATGPGSTNIFNFIGRA